MSTINKEDLIEWLEKEIEYSVYHGIYHGLEPVLKHIRALPSRPSDAELWAFVMSETLKMDSIDHNASVGCEFLYQDEPHVIEVYYKPEDSQSYTGEGFVITDPMPDRLRAILEPLYTASQPSTAKDE